MKVGDRVRLKKTVATIEELWANGRYVLLDRALLNGSLAKDVFKAEDLEVVPDSPVEVTETCGAIRADIWGLGEYPEYQWMFNDREQARQVAEAVLRYLEESDD